MANFKSTQRKYIEQGLCVYCGKQTPEEGRRGCQTCNQKNREKVALYKEAHPEKVKGYQQATNRKRREHRLANGLCTQCGKPSDRGAYCLECLIYHADAQKLYTQRHPGKSKEYRRKLRCEILEKYGGKCECCQENRFEFLAIDHRNNDGAEERRKLYGGKSATTKWLLKLKKEPVRDDLRVLCHNCNLAIGFYGYCPHNLNPAS